MTERHLYESNERGGLHAKSLCGLHYPGLDPVRATRLAQGEEPLCPRCAAVQERRLAKRRKGLDTPPANL